MAAAFDLPYWEKRYCLVGDRVTLNEFVALAEEIGEVPFEKHYGSIDILEHIEYVVLLAMR